MGVGGDHQLVGAGPLGQVVEAGADLVGGAVDDVDEPVVDELPLHRAEGVRLRLLGCRDQPGAAGAQAQHRQGAGQHLAAGLALVVGGQGGDADQGVRSVQHRGRLEGLAVQLQGRNGVLGREVVREGEGQAEHAGQPGAEAGGAEQPQGRAGRGLDAALGGGLDGSGDRVDAGVGVAVGEVVVQEARQLHELLREVVRALVEPLRAAQGGGGGAVGAGGPAEAEVDTAGGHGLQRAELFGDDERGVVGQHDAAGAEPDALGAGGSVGQDHGRRGGGDAGHGVVLGDPVAVEAAALGELGDLDTGPQGLGRGAALAHRHEVKDREGHGCRPLRLATDLVASNLVHVLASPVVLVCPSSVRSSATGG